MFVGSIYAIYSSVPRFAWVGHIHCKTCMQSVLSIGTKVPFVFHFHTIIFMHVGQVKMHTPSQCQWHTSFNSFIIIIKPYVFIANVMVLKRKMYLLTFYLVHFCKMSLALVLGRLFLCKYPLSRKPGVSNKKNTRPAM